MRPQVVGSVSYILLGGAGGGRTSNLASAEIFFPSLRRAEKVRNLSPTFNNTISQTSPGCRHHITRDAGIRALDRRDGDLVVRDTTGLFDRRFDGSRLARNKCADDAPDHGLAGRRHQIGDPRAAPVALLHAANTSLVQSTDHVPISPKALIASAALSAPSA